MRYRAIEEGKEEKEEDKGAIGILCLSDCSFNNIFSTALVIEVNCIKRMLNLLRMYQQAHVDLIRNIQYLFLRIKQTRKFSQNNQPYGS